MGCADGSPISGVDRLTGAGVAGGVETGVGEATPLHPQNNIVDNTQSPESKHRFLRTVAVFNGVRLLSAVLRSPLMIGSGPNGPSRTALGNPGGSSAENLLGWATFASLHRFALKEAGSRDDFWVMVELRDLNWAGNQSSLPGGGCLRRR